jgi:hypothetical protein
MMKGITLWNVVPLLGNGRAIATVPQPLPSYGSANMHVFTAAIAIEQRSGDSGVDRLEMYK